MSSFRSELASELTSFYEFLVSMYLPADSLKHPPATGWEEITQEHLAFMKKDDLVIDILKHIPYVRRDDENAFLIYEGCACNDYTGKHFEKYGIRPQNKEAMDAVGRDIPSHVVTLARAEPGDNGHYIFFDTKNGTLRIVDFVSRSEREFPIKEFFNTLKDEYRTLRTLPLEPQTIQFLQPGDSLTVPVPEIYRRNGWPTNEYRKENCMSEVKRHWDSFFDD